MVYVMSDLHGSYEKYIKMLEKGKKKYAYEIVELAREISEGK